MSDTKPESPKTKEGAQATMAGEGTSPKNYPTANINPLYGMMLAVG